MLFFQTYLKSIILHKGLDEVSPFSCCVGCIKNLIKNNTQVHTHIYTHYTTEYVKYIYPVSLSYCGNRTSQQYCM